MNLWRAGWFFDPLSRLRLDQYPTAPDVQSPVYINAYSIFSKGFLIEDPSLDKLTYEIFIFQFIVRSWRAS